MERVEIPVETTGPIAPGTDAPVADPSQTQQTDAPQDRPEWLPEGFDSPEALAEAYKAMTSKQQEAPPPTADETAAAEKLGKFSQEFFANGELSQQSYEELAKLGYPRMVVDQFIAGQRAVLASEEAKVYSEVGGQEAYGQMLEWAGQNLKQDEVAAYNAAVESGDMNQVMFAVRGLQARYAAANRGEPKLVSGSGKTAPAAFRSVAEMVSAMSDPRYKTDPAYRSDVERRLANSNII